MDDDDAHRGPTRARGRAARLASPAGLILAGLCLLLPFMSASCASEEPPYFQWRATYTGADVLTGGRPEVAFTDDARREPIRTLGDTEARTKYGALPESLPPQPVAWLAVALMVAALAATAVPSPMWRRTAVAGLALAAAVVLWGATVLARRDATDAVASVLSGVGTSPRAPVSPELRRWEWYGQVSDLVHFGYGLWTALAVLAAVGVANTVGVIRGPVRDRPPV